MLCKQSGKGKSAIIALTVGVLSLAFGIIGMLNTPDEAHEQARLMGMFTGFGTGILGVAAYYMIRKRVVKPEKLAQEEIERTDERNVALNRAALSVAAFAAVLAFALLAFVLLGLGYVLPSQLCIIGMYVEAAAYVIARVVLNKKM